MTSMTFFEVLLSPLHEQLEGDFACICFYAKLSNYVFVRKNECDL